jgi:WD40 repeat protein
VAAAIGLVAVVLILVNRPGEDTRIPAGTPSTMNPTDAAEEVATGFLGAYGAFDAEKAITYLADDADITGMTEGMGVDGLSLMTSLLEAQGYRQTITSCEATTYYADTYVHCAFDFHAIRSDEIGLGPYSGSYFDVIVRDGEIVRASNHLEIERFSPQMWEPFRDWVSTTYPRDFEVMYTEGGTNFRLTEESIRLWERRTREYVKEVQRTEGRTVDYVIDLNTDVRTPLPEAIIRSLGGTAEGRRAESQYAASPVGSLLAYVGTGEEGSPQIFIAGINGTGIGQVTHDPFGAGSPAWSPDGTLVAYQGGNNNPRDLFVLDVATGESRQIADGVADPYSGLQFAPDGSSLVYTGGSHSEPEMRTLPVAGGQSSILFGAGRGGMGGALRGSFSPDGSLVTMMGHEGRRPRGAPIRGQLRRHRTAADRRARLESCGDLVS